jgi:LuxR family transcriptional regulator, maltose regulon positive regulatory protein
MPAPLLRTKFFIPLPHPLLIQRPRLIESLENALRLKNRLILLSAPAGYGKTTLISDWAAANQHASTPAIFCWLSLDIDDNDLYRFWRYFIAALQTANSGIGRELVEQLASSPPPPVTQFLVMLMNDLAALQHPLVLVLDDFHVIENKAIQDSLTYLLEHLPEHIHLVLSTRADPSLPLHRFRGRSQLTELRADDLRFTIDEAAAFMKERLGVPLDRKDTELLEARIEGWVTGLQMAALSMQGRQDWRSFLDQFTGSHHYILDYLTEEVISQQPPAVQTFLMRTSIADRFCAPLCDALLDAGDIETATDGFASSQEILSYLESSNLFLVPLDNERKWFRYHHLFGDLLLARLRQLHPGLAEQLYLRASEWSEAQELGLEAIRYAIKGKHFDRAAELLEQRNQEMWAHSSVIQMRMVQDIPHEVIQRRPWLLLGRLWTLVITGQYPLVLPALNELEQAVHDRPEFQGARTILGFTAAVRAYISELQGQKANLDQLYTNAMGVLNTDRTGVGNTAGFMLGYVLYINGRFEDAEPVLFDSVKTDLADNTTNALPISMSRVGRLRAAAGKLHTCAALYQDVLEVMEKRGAWRYYLSGLMNLGLADVLLEWNDVDAAGEQALIGIVRNNDWGIPHAAASGYATQARIQLAQGQARLAMETIESGEEQVGKAVILPDARAEIDAVRVRVPARFG